ncbi:hypothetical protein MARCHEWKA_02550 [Brevundimonas phage vB_BpoS-Marchewka]|uniref:Uncharacterized protein n=1 Tax=Brevundimonas phage vB_BpoS-Marchewka TaxID=2948604 RepID=A0A9E7N5E9_9CAUD|nr:hypothetical protein MARCHEWKA_02550 [Brevundimonas phage vB_BpoS-Marchewka]UTC29214.1 hypothetical protein BAMBUS_01320 [Brevundimonas phage vB_BpoS-Bambus]
MNAYVVSEAELKRHCRWKIEDADLLRNQGRITDQERDRRIAQAWADLNTKLEARNGDP